MPQFPPAAVTAAKPVAYPVQSYYEYNGYLDSVETVQIKARVKGFLQKVHYREGDEVQRGADLYTIDPREYQANVAKSESDIEKAEADIENAKAQIALAEAELTRTQRTFDKNASAKTDLDQAVATLSARKAALKTAIATKHAGEAALQTAQLDLSYTHITSPITGRINRTLVTQGNLVGQNETTQLTTIVRMDELYVYFDAAERDLIESLRTIRDNPTSLSTDPRVLVEIGVESEHGFPHAGYIDYRENRVDTNTGTVRVRGCISNPLIPPGNTRLLYPGLFARVRVPSGPQQILPVIPEDALMTGQEGRYVYVIGPENKVQKRTVVVGSIVWKTPTLGEPTSTSWMMNPPPESAKPPAGPGDPAAKAGPPSVGPPPPPAKPILLPSMVAIEKGLTVDDVVIVNGLIKAKPGFPVAPEVWTIQAPQEKK